MAARRDSRRTNRHFAPAVRLGVALCASFFLALGASVATQDGPDYVTGTVQSGEGTEAGVWVIAETDDLPTNFIKMTSRAKLFSCASSNIALPPYLMTMVLPW